MHSHMLGRVERWQHLEDCRTVFAEELGETEPWKPAEPAAD